MKKITQILSVTLILITLISCESAVEKSKKRIIENSPQKSPFSSNDLSVNVDFIKSGEYIKGGPGNEYVEVHNLIAHVKNVSEDTVFVSAWSCSKEAQFTTEDTLNYSIHSYMMCYSNFPVIEAIAPGSSYSVQLMVRYNSESKDLPFRIGFIYTRHEGAFIMNKPVNLGIVWSDNITPN